MPLSLLVLVWCSGVLIVVVVVDIVVIVVIVGVICVAAIIIVCVIVVVFLCINGIYALLLGSGGSSESRVPNRNRDLNSLQRP